MAKPDSRGPILTAIGEVATPPFVRLPDPATAVRTPRRRGSASWPKATNSALSLLPRRHRRRPAPRSQDGLPEPATARRRDARPRARIRHAAARPRPLRRRHRRSSATLDTLLGGSRPSTCRPARTAALGARAARTPILREREHGRDRLGRCHPGRSAGRACLSSPPRCRFISPALAARLDPTRSSRSATAPAPPAAARRHASMVVGWHGADGARYCACALCGTLWNYVRVKCALCALDQGHPLSGDRRRPRHDQGRNLRRLPRLRQDPLPAEGSLPRTVADDVASLGLDLLMRETRLPPRRRQPLPARLLTARCGPASSARPARRSTRVLQTLRRRPQCRSALRPRRSRCRAACASCSTRRAPRRHASAPVARCRGDRARWRSTALEAASRRVLRPVFNLTGTVLHTNLGRALLAEAAVEAAVDRHAQRRRARIRPRQRQARRARRSSARPVCELTGAEDATVVNNNAAAVLLVAQHAGATAARRSSRAAS